VSFLRHGQPASSPTASSGPPSPASGAAPDGPAPAGTEAWDTADATDVLGAAATPDPPGSATDPAAGSAPPDEAQAVAGVLALGVAVPDDADIVEILGTGVRLRGFMRSAAYGRFSDHVNFSLSGIHLYEASMVDRAGHTHAILSEDLIVTKRAIAVLAELRTKRTRSPGAVIAKLPREIVAITPGFVVTGQVHLAPLGSALVFLESDDPPFIPMTNVEVRSRLGDGMRVRYSFALLNRDQIAAVGERPMGAKGGRKGARWDSWLDDPDD
jgi:hypothetical protein